MSSDIQDKPLPPPEQDPHQVFMDHTLAALRGLHTMFVHAAQVLPALGGLGAMLTAVNQRLRSAEELWGTLTGPKPDRPASPAEVAMPDQPHAANFTQGPSPGPAAPPIVEPVADYVPPQPLPEEDRLIPREVEAPHDHSDDPALPGEVEPVPQPQPRETDTPLDKPEPEGPKQPPPGI